MTEGKRIERALFVDRDGVLNRVVLRGDVMSSPRSWQEFVWAPELDALPKIKRLGFRLILVSNQPDIERGLLSSRFLAEVNEVLAKRYLFDGIYICPYASNSHPWKKPNPGLFLKAAVEFGLVLGKSFHLGDSENDLNAAHNAGCQGILWEQPYNGQLPAGIRVSSYEQLSFYLQSQLK